MLSQKLERLSVSINNDFFKLSKSNLHRITFVNLLRVTFFEFGIVSYFETFFVSWLNWELRSSSIILLYDFLSSSLISLFLEEKKKTIKKFQNARKKSFDVHSRKVRPCGRRKATSTHFPNGKSKKEKNNFFLSETNTFLLLFL